MIENKTISNHDRALNGHTIALFLNFLTFLSFYVINYTSYGSNMMFGLGIIYVLSVASFRKMRIQFRWQKYYSFITIFCFFCLFSTLWASDRGDPVGKSVTIIKCMVLIVMMMFSYEALDDISVLLQTIIVSGFVVTIYAIFTYGLDTMRAVLQEYARLDYAFANVNTIGCLAAMAVVIEFYFLLNRKIKWYWMLLALPCIYMIAATASRKAIIILACGLIMDFLFYKDSNDVAKKVLRLVGTILLVYIAYKIVSNISIFDSVNKRMETMMNMYLGNGYVDRSARTRYTMIQLGISQFLKTPIFGIGIGCGHLINIKDVYLHNNFIEILVGGGLVGFSIYYSMYFYLVYTYFKYWKYRDEYTRICLILIALLLLLDYGSVTYGEKQTYYFLMVLFLNAHQMRTRARSWERYNS